MKSALAVSLMLCLSAATFVHGLHPEAQGELPFAQDEVWKIEVVLLPPVSDNPLNPGNPGASSTPRPGFPPATDDPLDPGNPEIPNQTPLPGLPPVSDSPINPEPELPNQTPLPGHPPVSDVPPSGGGGGTGGSPWANFRKFFHV